MKKKVDSRIRTLIENGVAQRHRTFIVLVGDKGKDQVRACSGLRRRRCDTASGTGSPAARIAGGQPPLHPEQISGQSASVCSLVLQKRAGA